MTNHVWKHWFWVTRTQISTAILLIGFLTMGTTGLPPSIAVNSSTNSSISSAPTSIPGNSFAVLSRSSSDTDDTINGEISDMVVPYPVKKYSPGQEKKYRQKPKTDDSITTVEKMSVLDVSIKHLITIDTNDTIADIPNTTVDQFYENVTENFADEVQVTELPADSADASIDEDLAVAAATSVHQDPEISSVLDAGSITGITLAIVVVCGLTGAISFVLYRRRYLNKPQVLNDKSSTLDSSGYIDDTSLRENSEEMYSLDNDSFLNSLEAMTIQNYWTETVKHTKL